MVEVGQIQRPVAEREFALAVVGTAVQMGIVAFVGHKLRESPFHFWKAGLACASVTLIAGGRNACLIDQQGETSRELQEAWARRDKLERDDLIVIHDGVRRGAIGSANRKQVKQLNAMVKAANDRDAEVFCTLHSAFLDKEVEELDALYAASNDQEVKELNALIAGSNYEGVKSRSALMGAHLDRALNGLELAEPDAIAERACYYLLRPAVVSFVFATEVLSIVAIGLSYLTLKRDRSPDVPNPDQPPIILVHGRSSNEAQWPVTRPLLKRWGYENVYSLNLDDRKVGPPTNTFAEYEERLEALIDKALEETGQEKAILIGHSMGGLLSVRAAKTGKVQAAMTIGSPLAGTDILTYKTDLGLPIRKADHAMLPGSPEVREAQALMQSDKAHFYTIAMREDCIVFSGDRMTALHPKGDPARQHVLSNTGHIGAVLSPVTHQKLRGWLKGEFDPNAS